MEKEKLWTKAFTATSIVNFVLMLSMYLLLVTMAGYAMETYGTTTSMGGFVASVFIIGALVGRLYAGKKITQIGAKRILLLGIFIFIIMSFIYYMSIGVYSLIAVRIVQGIGLGFATTATGTIVSQVIPQSRNGEGISYFSISIVLSAAIGPLIGIELVQTLGYTSIFIFSTIIGLLSLVLALPLQVPVIEADGSTEKGRESILNQLFEKNAIPISIVLLIVALGYAGILSFITSYAEEIGLAEIGGFFCLVSAVVVLLTRPFTGKLMDLKGANIISYPGLLLFAAGMLLLAIANSGVIFLLAAVLIGLGYGNFQSCTQAIAIKLTPIERMGLANSTYFIFLDFALGIGPLLLGFIEPVLGYRGMYGGLVVIILIGLVFYYMLHGRKDAKLLEIEK